MNSINRIVIIEDEEIVARNLQRSLVEELPDAHVVAIIPSIEESLEFFQQNPMPDLIFMDIHLADGIAFSIFESVEITCPIIFTTAYEQYALDAFRVNTIDYLLKPIGRDDLHRAIQKLLNILKSATPAIPSNDALRQLGTNYKSHFLIPVRDRLIPVEVSQIACIYLEDKISRAMLFDGRQQIIDRPLDAVMDDLNPTLFFRANRQYIVTHSAIQDIAIWPISKLALTLSVPTPTRIIISKARVPEFKQWYTK